MKINKAIILLTAIMLLLSFCVISVGEYQERGYNNQKTYLNDERGIFNTGIENVQLYARNLVNNLVQQPPIIYDYDNDGNNNIIVSDGSNFIFMDSKDLIPIGSLDVGQDIKQYSIFKYSGTVYLVFSYDVTYYKNVSVYSFNGTDFNHFATHTASGLGLESAFTCDENTGYCLYVQYAQATTNAVSFKLNNVNTLSEKGVLAPSSNYNICYPSIPDILYYNQENDNNYEFYFSASQQHQTIAGSVSIYVVRVSLNSTGEIYDYDKIITRTANIGLGVQCSQNKQLYTSPLIMDVDLLYPNDIVIGMTVDTDEYKMFTYKIDGSVIDDYPEVFNADGVILSNVIKGRFFDHNYGEKDFCVLGYLSATDNIDLLCASEQIPEILGVGNAREYFTSDGSSTFDIDLSNGYQNMIHASQHSALLIGSTDLNEILTPFGVARITENDKLEYIYQQSIPNSILIDSDFEDIGLSDLIVQSKNALVYIDDLYDNQPAEFDSYSINPCIDRIWDRDTTVGITITGDDIEGDLMRAKAVLYYHHPTLTSVSTAWSNYVAPNTPISLSLVANKDTTSAELRLFLQDIENPNENRTISLLVTVDDAPTSAVYGDCITTVTGLYEEVIDAELEDVIDAGEVGAPCTVNADCDSNLCQNNFCALKGALDSCEFNNQCLSGNCVDNKCTKPSTAQLLSAGAEDTFNAKDITSKTIVSVIALFLIAGVIVVFGRNLWACIVAFLILVIGTFALTIAGWMTPFILIGVLIFMLVLVVLAIIIGGRG